MRIRVKFCGITSIEDRDDAVKSGADAIGLVFFKDSPRSVTIEKAVEILEDIPPFVSVVGVFVNEDMEFIEECVERLGLNAVQLHGDEDVKYCLKFKNLKFIKGVKLIKAIRVRDRESLAVIEDCPADAILLDAYRKDMYGGTSKGFDRSLAIIAKEYGKNLIISGGLTPDNVYEIIKEVKPYGVDVSSGIESSPGKKNLELMEQFIQEVRRIESEL
ncbi:MAG: phosphoribosylanthranilate isomerase [Candidatus Omnitrophota bacterium]|nr:phosphoribosylanthranilate isomerase [Candidatus Omnitrophota bacterium]